MCLEQKVVMTLDELKSEVATYSDECIATAADLREQLASAVQSARTSSAGSLADAVNGLGRGEEGLLERSLAAVAAVDSVRGALLTSLTEEREASQERVMQAREVT